MKRLARALRYSGAPEHSRGASGPSRARESSGIPELRHTRTVRERAHRWPLESSGTPELRKTRRRGRPSLRCEYSGTPGDSPPLSARLRGMGLSSGTPEDSARFVGCRASGYRDFGHTRTGPWPFGAAGRPEPYPRPEETLHGPASGLVREVSCPTDPRNSCLARQFADDLAFCPPEYRSSRDDIEPLRPESSGVPEEKREGSSGTPEHSSLRPPASVLRRSGDTHAPCTRDLRNTGTQQVVLLLPRVLRGSGIPEETHRSTSPRRLAFSSGTPELRGYESDGGSVLLSWSARTRPDGETPRVLRHSGTPEHSRVFCDDRPGRVLLDAKSELN